MSDIYLQMSANMSEIPFTFSSMHISTSFWIGAGCFCQLSSTVLALCMYYVHPWEKGAWVTFSKMRFLLLCIHYIYLHIQILWLGVVIRTLPMKCSMLKSLPENVGMWKMKENTEVACFQ